MSGRMQKNFKITGSGVLNITDDMITVCVDDVGEFNLAAVLAELDGCFVKFNFSYDEDYNSDEEEYIE